MRYQRFYTINDAKEFVTALQQAGYKAYYQIKNSYNYEVRYWL